MAHSENDGSRALTIGAHLRRRDFLALAGAGTLGLLAQQSCTSKQAPISRKPNVIIILADDLGYGDVCCYSCHDALTPNIDLIAQNGMRFSDGYVSAPVCSPSRAALMTGRHQQRYGHEFNAGGSRRCHEMGLGLPTSEIALAQLMKDAGYVTGIVGKWHLGSQPQFHPMARGFDEFFGFLHGANLYIDPSKPGVRSAGVQQEPSLRTRSPINPIMAGRETVEVDEYLTDVFTREALDFIERHKSEPFFLYLPYNAPHTPLQATQEYYDCFAHIEDEHHRIYMAMVSAVDDGVGAVLDKLKETNLEEDTVVFFLSDNGCATYTSACYNDPLKAGKLFLFEGGIRIPFSMQWKGHIKPGHASDMPVSSMDIFPTVLALAGGQVPEDRAIDGVNLMPYIMGEKRTVPHEMLFWRSGTNSAVRKGNWKLVNLNQRTTLLYDLSKDVAENNDVAGENPDVVDELTKAFAAWNSEMVEPLWPTRRVLRISLEPYGIPGGTYEFFI